MRIDCERCPNRVGDRRCDDCLVGFVLQLEDEDAIVEADDREADGTVLADADEARAIRALSDAGLVGPIRVVPLDEAG